MPLAARLPGIYFDVTPPGAAAVLPRMDVAAFAGFAAAGPVGIPIAVEDADRFHEIFGEDLPLAWDCDRGEMAHAQLAPTVRAFFRNGGRRCWVLRLTGAAATSTFVVPGLLRFGAEAAPAAALLEARAPGSWADDLQVNATLTQRVIGADARARLADGFAIDGLAGGELVRIEPADSSLIGYFAAPPLAPPAELTRTTARPQRVLLARENGIWFAAASPAMLAATGSPPATAMQPSRVRALRGAVDDEVPSGEWSVSRDGNAFELRLSRAAAAVIGPGSWLRLDFAAEPTPLPSVTLFLLVEEARESAAAMSSGALLSPGDGERVSVLGRRAWWMLDAADGWSLSANKDFQATTVALDLWVRHPRRSPWRMERLGLTAADPRCLSYLPSDSDLFAPRERSDLLPGAALRAAAAQPRFPLAGQPFGDEPPLFIPLGVPPLPRDDLYQPAVIPLGTPLERDGLRTFDEHLFLDPDLAGETVATLPTAAFFKQYQRPPREGGGPPVGLYALLGTAEASLFAVPDAVQRGWVSRTEQRQPLGAPALAPVDGPDDEARLTLSWRAEPLADAYTVEESPDAQFARAIASTRVERNTTVTLVRRSECPAVLYFRVRAEAGRDRGPWSNTERSSLSVEPFTPCGLVPFDAPTLEPFEPAALEPASASRRLHLAWYGGAADADEYVLEMAADAGFASAQQVYTGTSTTTDIWAPGGDVAYFRVAALRRGERSPWSNTISTSASIIQRWELLPLEEPERHGEPGTNESILRRIHRAMLRIAAARSDIFAVLSLPAHYRERAALTYRGRLAADLGGDAEARTLSFAALYHPATVVRDHSGSAVAALRLLVPDGSVCGRIASRASAAGAWVAPANELLEGVVMLEPTLAADAPAIFAGQPCNILQPQPRGFVLWSDATLSDDRELRAIGVRRLLILLRRLALREGNTFVFESNGDSFRRLVQRQFDRVLGDLFRRGAFAGATADEAYRVVTDRSVNTRQSLDAGRFIIEWRVAPSSPLAFLTVRLVHTGSELLLQEA